MPNCSLGKIVLDSMIENPEYYSDSVTVRMLAAELLKERSKTEEFTKALKVIAKWSQEEQDEAYLYSAGISLWRGCIAIANLTLKKLENK